MTIPEILSFANLILLPILVYVIKLERKLVIFEVKGEAMQERLGTIDQDLRALHRRMDHFGVPHASATPPP